MKFTWLVSKWIFISFAFVTLSVIGMLFFNYNEKMTQPQKNVVEKNKALLKGTYMLYKRYPNGFGGEARYIELEENEGGKIEGNREYGYGAGAKYFYYPRQSVVGSRKKNIITLEDPNFKQERGEGYKQFEVFTMKENALIDENGDIYILASYNDYKLKLNEFKKDVNTYRQGLNIEQ